MTERSDLIDTLDRHRGFLLQTAQGLSEEQARTKSTVSALTIASLLKHVADTEAQWMQFARDGAEAFGGDSPYAEDVDWSAIDAEAATNDGDWSDSEWVDDRFDLADDDTLEVLVARVLEVGRASTAMVQSIDLDLAHPLPSAPWFEQGASWSVRRVVLHVIAEIAQHAGHADIIRETIDGSRTMG